MPNEATELDEALSGVESEIADDTEKATKADDVSEEQSDTPPEDTEITDEATEDEDISSIFDVPEERKAIDRDRVFESTVNKAVSNMLESDSEEDKQAILDRLPKKFQDEALKRHNSYFEEETAKIDDETKINHLLNKREFATELKTLIKGVEPAQRAKVIAKAKELAKEMPNINDLGKKGAERLYKLAEMESGITRTSSRKTTQKPRSTRQTETSKGAEDWENMDSDEFMKLIRN